MMGDTHKLQGTAVGLIVAPWITDSLPAAVGVVGLSTFFALVPDIDHKNSTITKLGGFATRALSFIVRLLSRHRGLTHSALGIGLMTLGLLALLPEHQWVALGAMTGCLTHVAGDMATKAKVYFWWPSKTKVGFANIKTGGSTERVIFYCTFAAVALTVCWYVWDALGLTQMS